MSRRRRAGVVLPGGCGGIRLSRVPPLTVIIACANVEETLAAACESVTWADELIVVDSGSTDATGEIAKRYTPRYYVEPWRGYGGQKKWAAELATHDWVFFLDGDEECSPQLRDEWARFTQAELDGLDLLLVPRRNYLMGRYARAWSPDRLTRIFHRRRVTWDDSVLHDTRAPSHPSRVRKLGGWIEHKRVGGSWGDYFSGKRYDERLLMVARQMHEKGKRAHWWDLLLRPWAAFLKFYLLKGGWRDGTFGLLVAQKSAVGVQLRYAALWAVQNGVADGKAPSPPR